MKLGHYQYECPDKEKNVNYAEFNEEEEEMLLMAFEEVQQTGDSTTWFLDSGCSNHMCRTKEWFMDFDDQFRQSVKLGDNSSIMAIGKGDIKLVIDGLTQIIQEVYYIPEIRNNLLSIGQFQEKNLTILMKHGVCGVYHPRRGLIMQSKMSQNRMFVVSAIVTLPTVNCLQITTKDISSLWHRRYGHLSLSGLKTLFDKKMVTGLPKIDEATEICNDCMTGKHHRESIPKQSLWRATKRLQLVHADICGPISPTSNSGKRYVITFIDNYSRELGHTS